MANKNEKKLAIRQQIIDAASIYSSKLAGKNFLYVFGNQHFELCFRTESFVHLTGVESGLSANDFYQKAKQSTLSTTQFSFSERHPHKTAKRKLVCLTQLDSLTDSLVCVVQDMYTLTITYKLGITNLYFTLGLTRSADSLGNNEIYVPMTLRVKDRAIENSNNAAFVDFIFSKDATKNKYDTLTFSCKDKAIPQSIRELLSGELLADL